MCGGRSRRRGKGRGRGRGRGRGVRRLADAAPSERLSLLLLRVVLLRSCERGRERHVEVCVCAADGGENPVLHGGQRDRLCRVRLVLLLLVLVVVVLVEVLPKGSERAEARRRGHQSR